MTTLPKPRSSAVLPGKFDSNKRVKVDLDKKKVALVDGKANRTLSFPGMAKTKKFSIDEAKKLFHSI